MVYLLVIILIITLIIRFDFSLTFTNKSYIQKNYWINFLLFTFILLAGLGAVGTDFHEYYNEYKSMPNLGNLTLNYIQDNSYYRPGWLLFFSTCKTFSTNYLFFHLIHAVIVNALIFRFIKQNTEYVFSALLFYFILNYLEFNYESIRETMAISIVLFGIEYLKLNKWYIFFIFALIAITFHESALISLLFPILYKVKKINFLRLILIIFFTLTIIIYANNSLINDSFLNFIPISYKINKFYTTIDLEVNYSFNYWVSAIPKIILPIYVLFFIAKFTEKEYKFSGFIIFLSVLSLLFAFSISKYFYRFSNYFMPFYWVLLSQYLVLIYSKNKKLKSIQFLYIATILILFIMVYQYGQFVKDEGKNEYRYSRYFPYKTILNYDSNK